MTPLMEEFEKHISIVALCGIHNHEEVTTSRAWLRTAIANLERERDAAVAEIEVLELALKNWAVPGIDISKCIDQARAEIEKKKGKPS